MSVDIYPDSRLKNPKKVVRGWHPFVGYINWVSLFCANCGTDWGGGLVPEESIFGFYLCEPCFGKLGSILGTYVEPDIAFSQKVKEEMLNKYGRELTPPELAEVLLDDKSTLSKLARDRFN